MNLLGARLYDPAVAVTKATSALLAMTALDTTNLRIAFTIPAHGMVRVRMAGVIHGATTFPSVLLGVMDGATIRGRVAPVQSLGNTAVATAMVSIEADFIVTGLTPGAVNWDAAYGVETVIAATGIKYGGPNDTTANNAFGGFVFELYDPRPVPTAVPGAANGLQICGANAATTYATLTSTGAFSVNGVNATSQTGDNFARLGAPAGASVSADIAAVKVDSAAVKAKTDNLPAAPASTTNITGGTITTVTNLTNAPTAGDLTATMKTSVTTAATAATPIAASVAGNVGGNVVGTVASVVGAVGSVTGNVGGNVVGTVASVVGAVASVTGNVGGNVAGSVASVTAGVTLAASAVQAIWDALTTALTTAGSIGKKIADWVIGTAQTGDSFARIGTAGAGLTAVPWNAAWDAEVQSEAADALNAYDPPTKAELDSAVAPLALETTLATASGFIDTEVAAIKAKTDQFTFTVPNVVDSNALLGGGGGLDAAGVRAALGLASANLDTQLGDLPTNAELAAALAGADDAVLAQIALVKAKSDLIPASPAAVGSAMTLTTGERADIATQVRAELGTELGRIDAATSTRLATAGYTAPDNAGIAAIDGKATSIQVKTNLIPATPAAVSDIPTALQNADALLDRSMGDALDTNNRTLLNAIRFLRNKMIANGNVLTVFKEDNVTPAFTSTLTTNAAGAIIGSTPT